jgi:hypothetical protein
MSFQLRRGGVLGGASVGALAVVALGAGMAGAQEVLPIGVSPSSGPAGTAITVTGSGCEGDSVVLLLLDGSTTLDDETTEPGADGSWSGTLLVDDGVEGGSTLSITADCLGGEVEYSDGSFSVSGVSPTTLPTTTTTTTTVPPATTTTTVAPGGPDPTTPGPDPTDPPSPTTTAPAPTPAPPPAAPVEGPPDYAG